MHLPQGIECQQGIDRSKASKGPLLCVLLLAMPHVQPCAYQRAALSTQTAAPTARVSTEPAAGV